MVTFLAVKLAVLFIQFLKCHGNMEGNIANGEYTDISKFPHATFLHMTFGTGDTFFCGASIINQRVLITAAHCVAPARYNFDIQVFAGATDLDQAKIIKKVLRVMKHRDFDQRTMLGDLALLMLSTSLPLGNNIKRVIIKRSFPENALAEVAGWGAVDEYKTKTKKLKHVRQKIWRAAECNQYTNLVTGTLCAMSKDGYPLYGDSGSALMSQDHQLLGVVTGRGGKDDLMIYTNVSFYYDWVIDRTRKVYCNERV